MNYPALLSFICGFSSLSLEILWIRLYSFAKLSTPAAFGFVLTAYLLGIALGAHAGSRACRQGSSATRLWLYCISALLISAVLSVVLPASFGWLSINSVESAGLDLLIMASASCVLAFVFPVAHHLGANRQTRQQGMRFALVYASNVLGAGLGPLITGYVLLDQLSLQQSFVVICLVQLLAAAYFALTLQRARYRWVLIGVSGALTTAIAIEAQALDPHALIQKVIQNAERAHMVVENRHGVITLFEGVANDDAVFGGNVYDGRTNLDPERNTNGLQRPLLLSVLQPNPSRVLMVGLSIGTWLALTTEFPGVKHIDVVEINPGYIGAAQAYTLQARALNDPRVKVVVDDARRWLRHHREERYDLVIMNTTWHWRSNSSLLLSSDFLRLVKSRMAAGAVLAFNATGSGDAFHTATIVFEHAYRYSNFVYAASFDFRSRKDSGAARTVYRDMRLGGSPLFAPGFSTIEKFLNDRLISIEDDQRMAGRPFEEVTDQNMITEFKYGRPLY